MEQSGVAGTSVNINLAIPVCRGSPGKGCNLLKQATNPLPGKPGFSVKPDKIIPFFVVSKVLVQRSGTFANPLQLFFPQLPL